MKLSLKELIQVIHKYTMWNSNSFYSDQIAFIFL